MWICPHSYLCPCLLDVATDWFTWTWRRILSVTGQLHSPTSVQSLLFSSLDVLQRKTCEYDMPSTCLKYFISALEYSWLVHTLVDHNVKTTCLISQENHESSSDTTEGLVIHSPDSVNKVPGVWMCVCGNVTLRYRYWVSLFIHSVSLNTITGDFTFSTS